MAKRRSRGAELFQPTVRQLDQWPDGWPETPRSPKAKGLKGLVLKTPKPDGRLPPADRYGVAFIIVRGGPWWRRVILWVPDRIRMARVCSLPFERTR